MVLFIILLTAGINIVLGILSYKKNPKSTTNQLLAVLAFIFAFWSIANYFSLNATTSEGTLFWIRTVMFITAPMAPILYLFVKAFPKSELYIKRTVFIPLAFITILLMILSYTPLVFTSVDLTKGINPVPGPGAALFGLVLIGCTTAAFYELIIKYRKSYGLEKQQLKFLILGIGSTFTLLIFTNFVFVIIFKLSDLVIFGPMFSLFFVGSIFYAIAKHRLLAVRLILARSVAYTFLIAVLASIYTLGVFFLSQYVFQNRDIQEERFLFAVLGVFVVLTFDPIKNTIQNATDRVFFRGKYNSDEAILNLTTIIASNVKLKDLTQKTLHKLLTTLQVEKGAFVIFRKRNTFTVSADGYKRIPTFKKSVIDSLCNLNRIILLDEEKDPKVKQLMHKVDALVAVPLLDRNRADGVLLLGSKKSGELYTPQDVKIIEIFGPIISIAIQNAKSYEEIKSFNKTLSDKVTAATKELQTSHIKLQALDKQKDRFLGMASHELKTPITSIKAFSQVLYRKMDQKEHKEYASLLENINVQTDKVTKLINDLLNVSNIEEGKLVLNKEKFDIDELVEKTISDMQFTTDTHKIVKEGSIKEKVYGDADRLSQVLSNLLTNAIKYSPHAEKVVVKVAQTDGHATISVKDFGPGIAKEDQEKIFNRFYRTRVHEETNIAGFGLGLYIAAEIIKRHNGSLSVTSAQGKGATFTFTIPLFDDTK